MVNSKTCSICQAKYEGWGNSAWPINDGRCCDSCDAITVIPARFRTWGRWLEEHPDEKDRFVGLEELLPLTSGGKN